MTHNLIRQIVRAHLEEASRGRRQQTRATVAVRVRSSHDTVEDVDALESEMTAQIESMDDKGVETSPLYERLMRRWL